MTLYTEGFGRFVTSTTAPIATGWSESCRVGISPTERTRLPRRTVKLGLDGTLIARSGDALVAPAPVDAISWNAQLHGFAKRVAG
jgi:hypothetical protein